MVADQNFHRVKKFFLLIFFLLFSSNSYSENSAKLNFDIIKKNGMITTFGNYISPKNKINTPWGSHYYLPSDTFAKRQQSEYSEVFWTTGYAWGNFNGDSKPDLLVSWELHNQCQGLGQQDTHTGTWFCKGEKLDGEQSMLPFSVFEVNENSRENIDGQLVTDIMPSSRNCMRPIVTDFNNDGIDDIYCGSAFSVKEKGNNQRTHGGADYVFISNGKGQWVRTAEKGDLVHKKHGVYLGFSHGITAADIDNDGDIDVITPHIKWENTKGGGKIYCHINDGKGNFTVKWCADQFAHAVTTGDYNGDGHVDLMASAGWHQSPAYKHNNSKKHNQTVILFGDSSGKFGKSKSTKKWFYMEPSYDIYGSGFLLTDVIGPVSWDFDNDGDVDIAGSSIGPLYVGGTHTIWENDGKGNFTVADQVPMIPSPDFVKTRKGFKKNIVMETNQWNSFCARSTLIDVNEDGLMDIMCDAFPQDKHSGWFFVNQRNLEFEKVSPYKAWENGWVDYYTGEYGGRNKKFEGFADANRMAPGKGMWKYKSDFE